MKIAVVRPFNVYGSRDPADGPKAHVIPAIISKALRGDPELTVAGTGKQSRAFLHVSDAVRAILLVTERYAEADPINIGSTREISIEGLVDLILTTVGRSMRVTYDPSLPEGNPRKLPDMAKFIALCGKKPDETPLERGLEETVKWFRTSTGSSSGIP